MNPFAIQANGPGKKGLFLAPPSLSSKAQQRQLQSLPSLTFLSDGTKTDKWMLHWMRAAECYDFILNV